MTSRGDQMLAKRRSLAALRLSMSELLPDIDVSNTPQILLDSNITSLDMLKTELQKNNNILQELGIDDEVARPLFTALLETTEVSKQSEKTKAIGHVKQLNKTQLIEVALSPPVTPTEPSKSILISGPQDRPFAPPLACDPDDDSTSICSPTAPCFDAPATSTDVAESPIKPAMSLHVQCRAVPDFNIYSSILPVRLPQMSFPSLVHSSFTILSTFQKVDTSLITVSDEQASQVQAIIVELQALKSDTEEQKILNVFSKIEYMCFNSPQWQHAFAITPVISEIMVSLHRYASNTAIITGILHMVAVLCRCGVARSTSNLSAIQLLAEYGILEFLSSCLDKCKEDAALGEYVTWVLLNMSVDATVQKQILSLGILPSLLAFSSAHDSNSVLYERITGIIMYSLSADTNIDASTARDAILKLQSIIETLQATEQCVAYASAVFGALAANNFLVDLCIELKLVDTVVATLECKLPSMLIVEHVLFAINRMSSQSVLRETLCNNVKLGKLLIHIFGSDIKKRVLLTAVSALCALTARSTQNSTIYCTDSVCTLLVQILIKYSDTVMDKTTCLTMYNLINKNSMCAIWCLEAGGCFQLVKIVKRCLTTGNPGVIAAVCSTICALCHAHSRNRSAFCELGILPMLSQLLRIDVPDSCRTAVIWAMVALCIVDEDISTDPSAYFIQQGDHMLVAVQMQAAASTDIREAGAWLLSLLCAQQSDLKEIVNMLGITSSTYTHDNKILTATLFALSQLLSKETIQICHEYNLLSTLCDTLISSENPSLCNVACLCCHVLIDLEFEISAALFDSVCTMMQRYHNESSVALGSVAYTLCGKMMSKSDLWKQAPTYAKLFSTFTESMVSLISCNILASAFEIACWILQAILAVDSALFLSRDNAHFYTSLEAYYTQHQSVSKSAIVISLYTRIARISQQSRVVFGTREMCQSTVQRLRSCMDNRSLILQLCGFVRYMCEGNVDNSLLFHEFEVASPLLTVMQEACAVEDENVIYAAAGALMNLLYSNRDAQEKLGLMWVCELLVQCLQLPSVTAVPETLTVLLWVICRLCKCDEEDIGNQKNISILIMNNVAKPVVSILTTAQCQRDLYIAALWAVRNLSSIENGQIALGRNNCCEVLISALRESDKVDKAACLILNTIANLSFQSKNSIILEKLSAFKLVCTMIGRIGMTSPSATSHCCHILRNIMKVVLDPEECRRLHKIIIESNAISLVIAVSMCTLNQRDIVYACLKFCVAATYSEDKAMESVLKSQGILWLKSIIELYSDDVQIIKHSFSLLGIVSTHMSLISTEDVSILCEHVCITLNNDSTSNGAVAGICKFIYNLRGLHDETLHKLAEKRVTDILVKMLQAWLEKHHVAESISKAITALHCVGGSLVDVSLECDQIIKALRGALTENNESAIATSVCTMNEMIAANGDRRTEVVNNGMCELLLEIIGSGTKTPFTRAALLHALCVICRHENRDINVLAVSRLLHNNGPFVIFHEMKLIGMDSPKISEHGLDLFYMFLKHSTKMADVFELKSLIALLGNIMKFHVHNHDVTERGAAVTSLLATDYANCFCIENNGILHLLINALDLHTSSAETVKQVLTAMGSIMYTQYRIGNCSAAGIFHSSDTVDTVVSLLSVYSSSAQLVPSLCTTLTTFMMIFGMDCQLRLSKLCACEAMISLLQVHKDDCNVLSFCCDTVLHLCLDCEVNRSKFKECGGLPILNSLLSHHYSSNKVSLLLIRIFQELPHGKEDIKLLIDLHIETPLLHILKIQSNDKEICRGAVNLLVSLVECVNIFDKEGFFVCSDVFVRFVDDVDICRDTAIILNKFITTSGSLNAINGAFIKALIDAMYVHIRDEIVITLLCAMTSIIIAEETTSVKLLVDYGCCDAVSLVLKKFFSDKEIALNLCHVVAILSTTSIAKEKFVASKVCEDVIKVMSVHSNSLALCCDTLSPIADEETSDVVLSSNVLETVLNMISSSDNEEKDILSVCMFILSVLRTSNHVHEATLANIAKLAHGWLVSCHHNVEIVVVILSIIALLQVHVVESIGSEFISNLLGLVQLQNSKIQTLTLRVLNRLCLESVECVRWCENAGLSDVLLRLMTDCSLSEKDILRGIALLLGAYVRDSPTRVTQLLDIGILDHVRVAFANSGSDEVIEAYLFLMSKVCNASPDCVSTVAECSDLCMLIVTYFKTRFRDLPEIIGPACQTMTGLCAVAELRHIICMNVMMELLDVLNACNEKDTVAVLTCIYAALLSDRVQAINACSMGMIRSVVSTMKLLYTNAEVVDITLSLLCVLMKLESVSTENDAMEQGAQLLDAIHSVLSHFGDNAIICGKVCAFFSQISFSIHWNNPEQHKILEKIASSLGKWLHDAAFVVRACEAICFICSESYNARLKFGAVGVENFMVYLLKYHLDSSDIVSVSLEAMLSLTRDCNKNRELCSEIDDIDVLVTILHKYVECPTVFKSACNLLLLIFTDVYYVRLDEDTYTLILEQLHLRDRDRSIVKMLCDLLSITHMSAEIVQIIRRKNIFVLLSTLMHKHESSGDVVLSIIFLAQYLFSHLSSDGENLFLGDVALKSLCTYFSENYNIPTCVLRVCTSYDYANRSVNSMHLAPPEELAHLFCKAAQCHMSDNIVIERIFSTIGDICGKCKDYVTAFEDTNVTSLLEEAFSLYSQDVKPVSAIFHALQHLSYSEKISCELTSCGIISKVIELIEMHTNKSPDICAASCSALSALLKDTANSDRVKECLQKKVSFVTLTAAQWNKLTPSVVLSAIGLLQAIASSCEGISELRTLGAIESVIEISFVNISNEEIALESLRLLSLICTDEYSSAKFVSADGIRLLTDWHVHYKSREISFKLYSLWMLLLQSSDGIIYCDQKVVSIFLDMLREHGFSNSAITEAALGCICVASPTMHHILKDNTIISMIFSSCHRNSDSLKVVSSFMDLASLLCSLDSQWRELLVVAGACMLCGKVFEIHALNTECMRQCAEVFCDLCCNVTSDRPAEIDGKTFHCILNVMREQRSVLAVVLPLCRAVAHLCTVAPRNIQACSDLEYSNCMIDLAKLYSENDQLLIPVLNILLHLSFVHKPLDSSHSCDIIVSILGRRNVSTFVIQLSLRLIYDMCSVASLINRLRTLHCASIVDKLTRQSVDTDIHVHGVRALCGLTGGQPDAVVPKETCACIEKLITTTDDDAVINASCECISAICCNHDSALRIASESIADKLMSTMKLFVETGKDVCIITTAMCALMRVESIYKKYESNGFITDLFTMLRSQLENIEVLTLLLQNILTLASFPTVDFVKIYLKDITDVTMVCVQQHASRGVILGASFKLLSCVFRSSPTSLIMFPVDVICRQIVSSLELEYSDKFCIVVNLLCDIWSDRLCKEFSAINAMDKIVATLMSTSLSCEHAMVMHQLLLKCLVEDSPNRYLHQTVLGSDDFLSYVMQSLHADKLQSRIVVIFDILHLICRDHNPNIVKVSRLNIGSTMYDVLENATLEPSILRSIFGLAYILTSNRELRDMLGRAGLCEFVCPALRVLIDSHDDAALEIVLNAVCGLLRENSGNQDALGKISDIYSLLVEILSADFTMEIMTAGLWTVALLCRHSVAISSSLSEWNACQLESKGMIELVCTKIQLLPMSTTFGEALCWSICGLAHNEKSIVKLTRGGADICLIRALEVYVANESLVEAALYGLVQLSRDKSCRTTLEKYNIEIRVENVLMTHLENTKVSRCCCQLLCLLSQSIDYQEKCSKTSIPRYVARLLQMSDVSNLEPISACQALCRDNNANREIFGENRACEVLTDRIVKVSASSDNNGLLQHLNALKQILLSRENLILFLAIGGSVTLFEAFSREEHSVEVYATAADIVTMIIRLDENAFTSQKDTIISVMVRATQKSATFDCVQWASMLKCLGSLLGNSETACARITDRMYPLVDASMSCFEQSIEFEEEFPLICSGLTAVFDNNEKNVTHAIETGACIAVVNAIECCSAGNRIHSLGRAFHVALLLCKGDKHAAEIFGEYNVYNFIVSSLELHTKHTPSLVKCLRFLDIYVQSKGNIKSLVDNGIALLIAKVLEHCTEESNLDAGELLCRIIAKISVESPEVQTQLGDCGISRLLQQLIKSSNGKETTLIACCTAITSLCVDAATESPNLQNLSYFRLTNVEGAIYAFMGSLTCSEDLLVAITSAFEHLCRDDGISNHLGDLGVCSTIVSFCKRANNTVVLHQILLCLDVLLNSTSNKTRFIEVGGVSSLNTMLARCTSEKDLALAALNVLMKLLKSASRELQTNIGEMSECLVQIMKEHVDSSHEVTIACCNTMFGLANKHNDNKTKLFSLGAVRLLISVSKIYESNDVVLVSAYGALRCLSFLRQIPEVLVQDGFCGALIICLKKWERHIEIVDHLLGIASNMVSIDSEAAKLLSVKSFCDLLVSVVKSYVTKPPIIMSFFKIIAVISSDMQTSTRLGNLGTCDIALRFLNDSTVCSAALAKYGTLALKNLAAAPIILVLLQQANTCEIVISVLQKYGESDEVVESGCHLLANIFSANPLMIEKCSSDSIVSIICTGLSSHAGSPSTVSAVLMLFLSIATNEKYLAALASLEVCESIVRAFSSHYSKPEIADLSLKSICVLCRYKAEMQDIFAKLNAGDLIMKTCDGKSAAELYSIEALCRTVASMCNNHVEHTMYFCSIGFGSMAFTLLEMNLGDVKLCECICEVIHHLMMNPTGLRKLSKHQYAEIMAKCLRTHFHEEKILVYACSIAVKMQKDEVLRTILVSNGVVDSLNEVISMYRTSANELVHVCVFEMLFALLEDKKYVDQICATPSGLYVLDMLEGNKASKKVTPLMISSLEILCNNARIADKVGSTEGLSCITGVMFVHSDQKLVLRCGYRVLQLVAASDRQKLQITTAAFASLTLDVCMQYQNDVNMLTDVLILVCNLCNGIERNANQFGKVGICSIIFRLLKTHGAVTSLCKIIFNNFGTLADEVDCINAFSKADNCKIYLNAMQLCSPDASVCCVACDTLSKISSKSDIIQNSFASTGGCDGIMYIVKSHLTNKVCAASSSNALLSLIAGNIVNTLSVATHATCDTLFEVVHMHSEIAVICATVACLFKEILLQNDELITYLISKKIRHIVVAALNRHQENESAVIAVLNLMDAVYVTNKDDLDPLPNECVLLRDWLEKFIDNSAVTECICRCIASMTSALNSKYIVELGDIGVCDFVARSVMSFCGINNKKYLLSAVNAVHNLCQGSSANQNRFGKCNVCAFIADSFRRFVNDADVAVACIKCIAVLARHTVDPSNQCVDNIRKLEIEGACECMLASFEVYSSHLPMMIEVCRAIWFFAFDESCNKKMLRLGVCTSTLQALRTYEKDALVSQYCMGALANFALTDEGCSVLSTESVVRQVMSCCTLHGKNASIMLQCGYTIANMCHKRIPVKKHFFNCGACPMLVDAIQFHVSNVELLTVLLVALTGLCDGVSDVSNALVEAKASVTLFNIALDLKSNENVCSEYISLLLNMCNESSAAIPSLNDTEICEYITQCMSSFPHNAYLVRTCVKCVVRFCAFSEAHIDRFLDCDIAAILIRCIKKSFTTRDTLGVLLKCLVHFMNANTTSVSRLISANAPKVLCKLYLDIDLKLRDVIVHLSSAIRQLCISDEMHTLFGNICKQATLALERYVEDSEVVLAICGALNAIVPKSNENIKKMHEIGACKVLIAVMVAQCRHQVCGREICNLVYAISLENEDNLLALSTKTMCTALAAYIDSYHGDYESCSAACRSIRALVSKQDNRIVMGQTGACSTIADALHEFCDLKCGSICDSIYALSYENPENAEIFGLRGACESILRVLQLHLNDASVLHPALKAMNMLCAVPANNMKFGLQDGCTCLYDIMGRYANDAVTLRYAVRAAASMAIGNDENKSRLCDAGISALLPKIMMAQVDNVRLVEICLIALVHVVKGNKRATDVAITLGTDALQDIAKVLSAHVTSKSIAKHACLVLRYAVECDQLLSKEIREAELCQLVISALISHLGSSGINLCICSSVRALAADPANRLILGSCGGCDIVPKLLRFAVDVEDLPLVGETLATLSALVQHSCINQEAIGRSGACDYVVELISADNGVDIDEKAMTCLAYLSRCGEGLDTVSEHNSQKLTSNGAIQSVIASMQEYSSNDNLVASAFNAIACMCCSDIISLQVGILGAIPILVDIAKEHLYNATISRYACQAFQNIGVGKNVSLFLQLHQCEYLVTVLRRHLEDETLFEAVCYCILHFVKEDARSARSQFFEEGICGVLIGQIRRHINHPSVISTACKALHSLCKGTLALKVEFGLAGACETMVHVAKTYSSNYYVQEAAVYTIRELAADCEENIERINVLGGLGAFERKRDKSLWESAVEVSE